MPPHRVCINPSCALECKPCPSRKFVCQQDEHTIKFPQINSGIDVTADDIRQLLTTQGVLLPGVQVEIHKGNKIIIKATKLDGQLYGKTRPLQPEIENALRAYNELVRILVPEASILKPETPIIEVG